MESHQACGVMPFDCGGIGHFLAMLVHARDERHVVAVHALVARDGIGGDGGVGRAQVRARRSRNRWAW